MRKFPTTRFFLFVAALALLLPGFVQAQPCTVPDDGSGTVALPPDGCEYLSPTEFHVIVNGLPPGTKLIIKPIHARFICETSGGSGCGQKGGTLGGEVENFESSLILEIVGTGALAGFTSTATVPATVETHTGPRTPGDPVQSFPTDMFRLQGTLTGHPDFDFLNFVAGTGNGLPSPGHTTLTQSSSTEWTVDSVFNVGYRVSFRGAPGSHLEGLSGGNEGKVTMRAASASDTTQ